MANQRDIDRWKKGKDHWNKWAEGRLKAKEKLEKEGKWEVDEDGEGANAETKQWVQSASVDFSKQVFQQDADFAGFLFPRTANFKDAAFEKDARFGGATFEETAEFGGAKFEGNTTFEQSSFLGDAEFRSTEFSMMAWFAGANFFRNAWFVVARFPGHAVFGGATFSGNAEFNRALFSLDAWFQSAKFLADAGFRQCDFEGHAYFSNSIFFGTAKFGAATFNGPLSIAGVSFQQVPDFGQASFRAPVSLDDMEVVNAKPFIIQGEQERAARYRALKRIAIESHDHVREQEFFVSELRERRGNDDPFLSPSYVLSFIYELLSNFGTSLKRPLAGLFGTWLVMAAAYGSWIPETTRQGCGWTTAWMAPEHYLSLLHTLPFVGLVRSGRRELALECLYGSKDGFSAGTDVLFIAHNTFATVLIFLFFLAVRNHFKIK